MNKRVKIAVSACLLGEKVRYDGDSKPLAYLTDLNSTFVEFISICPEADAGLGIPRPPMNLYQLKSGKKALTREDHVDKTDLLIKYTEKRIPELLRKMTDGIILKSKSPSCGIGTTPIYDLNDEQIETKSGIFAQAVVDHLSQLPFEDELGIHDPVRRRQFFASVFLYKQIKDFFSHDEKMIADLRNLKSIFILKSTSEFIKYFEWLLISTQNLMNGIVDGHITENEFYSAVQFCKNNDPNQEGLMILEEFLSQEEISFDRDLGEKHLLELIDNNFSIHSGTKVRDKLASQIQRKNNHLKERMLMNSLFTCPPELW